MKIILPLILSLSIISGCTKDQVNSDELIDPQSCNNVYGNWVVVSYENLGSGSIIKKGDVDSWGGMDIEIKFMDDSTFCGSNTSNSIAGHYTMPDSSFDIDVYGGTKVGQPDWGNMFSDVVYSHSFTYFKRSNTELRLFYNNNIDCIVLYPSSKEIDCRWTYSND